MTPERARSIVERSGWLSRQPIEFRKAVLGGTQLVRLPSDETYSSLGQPAGGITCVVDGLLEVLVAPGEFTPKLVYLARAGWWFGDIPLISRSERRAGLVAREDSWLLHLPERHVTDLANENSEAWRRFAELTVVHFDNALHLAFCMSKPEPSHRVAALICWLSGSSYFSEATQDLPLKREELAEIAGLSRNTVGRVLSELSRKGLIEAPYGKIIIISREGLEALLLD